MELTPELQLKMRRFKPRPYQKKIMEAVESGIKKILIILPRRAGKDICAFNIAIRQCLSKTCTVYYVLPTYKMARKVIWDNIDNDGFRVLDYAPSELCTKNHSELQIRFINGSILQLVGCDNYDSLVGSNFHMAIFSEFAIQNRKAWDFVRPIALTNGAAMIALTTPRGHNFVYDLYNISLNNPEWFVLKMNVEETGHISISAIQKEKEEGYISEDLIQQEYYCSFDLGIEGSYYSKYIDKLNLDNRITEVPYEAQYKVHTAWDLGVHDMTTIIFFQVINNVIHIIDYYEGTDKGLDHYVTVLQQKNYCYGKHIAPHDIRVREFTSGGITRLDKARQLGVKFIVCDNIPLADGIEAARSIFSRLWIDSVKCKQLIKALENYRKELDQRTNRYKEHPLHNWASNAADAFRYLAVSIKKCSEDFGQAERLEKNYREACGFQTDMPAVFRDDLPGY